MIRADLDAMGAWTAHADPRLAAYVVPAMTPDDRDAAWGRMHDDPTLRHLAAEIGGVCRGHIVLRRRDASTASLGIALDGAYTGQGYGRRILKALLGYSKTMEALERLTLDAQSWNERAIRAYTAAGFVVCDRADDILSMEAICAP